MVYCPKLAVSSFAEIFRYQLSADFYYCSDLVKLTVLSKLSAVFTAYCCNSQLSVFVYLFRTIVYLAGSQWLFIVCNPEHRLYYLLLLGKSVDICLHTPQMIFFLDHPAGPTCNPVQAWDEKA